MSSSGFTTRAAYHGLPCLLLLLGLSGIRAQGLLGTIQDDVHSSRRGSSSDHERDHGDRHHHHCHDHHDDDTDWGLGDFIGELVVSMFTSSSSDGSSNYDIQYEVDVDYYFPRFPYDCVQGYMTSRTSSSESDFLANPSYEGDIAPAADCTNREDWYPVTRRWAARLRADYATDLNDLYRIGGHMLISTSSGWGFDAEMDYLEENLPIGHNHLWIGDCNVLYRFAESERSQARWGLGLNWLDDPLDTEFGFNFTCGMDYFPAEPCVLSGTIDWGTLGSAELFRFRTTAGVVVRGVECYTGYEYLDIDRTQINSLIGGVRIWF